MCICLHTIYVHTNCIYLTYDIINGSVTSVANIKNSHFHNFTISCFPNRDEKTVSQRHLGMVSDKLK